MHSPTPSVSRSPASGLMVIYGASGDLAQRKLFPALHHLARDGLLTDEFGVIGVSSKGFTEQGFRDHLDETVRPHLEGGLDETSWRWLLKRVSYVSVDWEDPDDFKCLAQQVREMDARWGTDSNHAHYLATPPSRFASLVAHLCEANILRRDPQARERVIIEKPFGHDLDSAIALNRRLLETLDEAQIYRIDHYLGKETVQNLMVFRFANAIFEPIWNRRYVDHVQITVAEDLGIGHRAGYYDGAGALRDMVPNHMMQLLSLIAMEPPASFNAEAVRNAKGDVLRAIPLFTADQVAQRTVRGQYGPGQISEEGDVHGYREEEGIAPDSPTETFAALRLEIDNWRWAGVPFYLRTGKRMPMRQTEIVIQFKSVPSMMFRSTGVEDLAPNRLLLRIQPREAIVLSFGAKRPGPSIRIADADLEFCYRDRFGLGPSTGYETLLFDALRADATLFQRADSIEGGWAVIDPILRVWDDSSPGDFPNYAAGTWGPEAADRLMQQDGRQWNNQP
ncbi:glucose-6-phosphate dehydrogenase [Ectothiorhodospira variabilis]|uniref:glucose-6-phosphate dehydrogenase n=1 Tax=Ectothiorhodospira variabilis TaxID=505694 RepID=UPI001EFC19DE|nr:glucose-6-phosphate dehydrogenase [Ectothiorhodospira variabilis]MCG5495486.1 glucose-6-phosphate dehydrogenase [Ectothiorhodospira variabilis]MCG5503905.1 glucose-6-phosphate dehydrogenase [Ectothiorhodospira variabilis]MCG5506964.1 glucose-6-phosphate dehydrogenase [Ectothiorhodospira variabilis]